MLSQDEKRASNFQEKKHEVMYVIRHQTPLNRLL